MPVVRAHAFAERLTVSRTVGNGRWTNVDSSKIGSICYPHLLKFTRGTVTRHLRKQKISTINTPDPGKVRESGKT